MLILVIGFDLAPKTISALNFLLLLKPPVFGYKVDPSGFREKGLSSFVALVFLKEF